MKPYPKELTEDDMSSIFFEDDPDRPLVHKESWKDQGKFQTRSVIFRDDGKYYRMTCSRSGNHWSGYETQYPPVSEIVQVMEIEKVVKDWVEVG